ncbi:MAG: hypothetical protein JNL60_00440 [Bacteroidia bacterium]|nr:hypothetical protein [Bacteroidia bacterium]
MLKRCLNSVLLLVLIAGEQAFAQFSPPQLSKPGRNTGTDISFPMDLVMDQSYRYWIATFNGLVEYEGRSFQTHHMPLVQGKALGSEYLSKLLLTNDSTLWIAHRNGIARFNLHRKTFELIPVANLAAGASLNFIYAFKDSKNKPVFICNELGPLHFNEKSGQVEPLSGPAEAAGAFIFKISETADGKHYLLYTRNGLLLYNIAAGNIVRDHLLPASYTWISSKELKGSVTDYAEIHGKKYISVKDNKDAYYQILEFDPLKNSFRPLPLNSSKGRLFFTDSQGRLWIYGFGDQPAIYDPASQKLFMLPVKPNCSEKDFSLCYNISEDHEGNIWMCTNAGIFTYNLHQNSVKLLSEKVPTTIFSDISQVGAHEIWFGTLSNGIYKYNTSLDVFENINFLPLSNDAAYNDIWQIHKSAGDRNIWVIHANARISRFDPLKKKFFFYKEAAFEGDFLSICDDDRGNIFVATQEGVLFQYNASRDRFDSLLVLTNVTTIKENLEVNDIVSISENELLVATSGQGLIKINIENGSYKIYQFEPGDNTAPRSNSINVLKKFDNETVFAGTTNGIVAYNIQTGNIESFSYDERFNLGNVFQITKDKNNNLVFTGTSKMYLLNWKTKDITDLGQRSSITDNNLTEVYYSKNLDKLYVLSEESIYEVTLKNHEAKPEIKPVIYSLDSYGKIFYTRNGDDIFLKSLNNSFRLNFGSSTFKFHDDLEYYYSMDNEDWQRTEGPYITFSKLSGGDHTFRLKVVYTGNRKVHAETFLNIHIEKKFHETLWFYLLIFFALFGAIYVFYRIRLNKILAIEKVRFQLSRDLHDDMGSTLSTINILSSIAATKLRENPSMADQYIQRISQNSQQMMESMDDIVWSINPANDSMKKVTYRMREFASGILEPKAIQLNFEIDAKIQDLKINMAHRRDFFLIFKEAINNAVKYSECTRVRVKFYTDADKLVLLIHDNGKGFRPEQVSDGNGLVNMRKRAASINAFFHLESTPGEGTRIEIKLELKKL